MGVDTPTFIKGLSLTPESATSQAQHPHSRYKRKNVLLKFCNIQKYARTSYHFCCWTPCFQISYFSFSDISKNPPTHTHTLIANKFRALPLCCPRTTVPQVGECQYHEEQAAGAKPICGVSLSSAFPVVSSLLSGTMGCFGWIWGFCDRTC